MPDTITVLEEKVCDLQAELKNVKKCLALKQKSEAKYRRMIEELEDEYIFFTHDMNGRYQYVSPSIENILGIETGKFLTHRWDDLVHISEQSLIAGLKSDEICSQRKIPDPFELTVILGDSREIIFEVKERPIFDQDGTVVANEGIAKDVTERVRNAKILRAALDEIKTLQGIIPICANCKDIRDDKGLWQQIEQYVTDNSDACFTHGICPGCAKELYPDFEFDFNEIKGKLSGV